MNKKVIIRKILELSNREPTLAIVQATQLLTTALLIVDNSPVEASVLYSRAVALIKNDRSP